MLRDFSHWNDTVACVAALMLLHWNCFLGFCWEYFAVLAADCTGVFFEL